MPGKKKDDEGLDFELSEDDLKAIAEARSETVPDEPSAEETPFTIRNAPVAKSVMPARAFLRDLAPPKTVEDEDNDSDE